MKNQGFTLLELSIVIVVIGLIVGGIVAGSEMIKTAELNSMVRDVNNFKSATNTFRDKYNAWPGDMKNATDYWGTEVACPATFGSSNLPGTCNGNGNRKIDYVSMMAVHTNNEAYRFWEHLSLAGLIQGDYWGKPASSTASLAAVPGGNLPAHKMNGLFMILTRESGPTSWFTQTGAVFYAMGATLTQSSMTAHQAAALDSKFDDGRPGYGWIGQYTNAVQSGCVTAGDATVATYDLVTNQNPRCQTHFWYR